MKKQKNLFRKLFKFFEPVDITRKYLTLALKDIGWLSKMEFKEKDKNVVKVGSKTIVSEIVDFSQTNIEFKIELKNVGSQVWSFNLEATKRNTVLEISSIMIFNDEMNKKNIKHNLRLIKNSFSKNVKQIDSYIRDLLEKDGYKSYF